MKTRIGVPSLAILLGFLGLFWVGCPDPEASDVDKIGRYAFTQSEAGFEIHEASDWLTRFFERITGRAREAKIRVGEFSGGSTDRSPEAIGQVVVRERKLVGPEVKQSVFKRLWEVRLFDPSHEELPFSFRFRFEADARAFANDLRRRLAESKGSTA